MSSLLSHKSIRAKKSTHGTHAKEGKELGPVDVLVDRNQQLKHITKSLIDYHQGLADIEHHSAKSTHSLCDTIQVPFHEGHAFLGDGGWQEVFYTVRDKTKVLSEHHASMASSIEKGVIKELEEIRSELKTHISAIEKDAGVLANEVDKERTASAHHLTTLQQGIDTFENSHHAMLPQHDPYLTHTQAHTQLTKQMHKENDLQSAVIKFQSQQPSFEANIFKNIQAACKNYDEARIKSVREISDVQESIAKELQKVENDAEFKYFASKEGSLIDPNAPTRSVDALQFPGQNHPSALPIKEGLIERKKRFTKTYKESYYVLTPSGFLHERKSDNDETDIKPQFSLFLPECSLGAPAKESDKSHKWHVEGNKAVKSTAEKKMKTSLRFGSKEIAYSFRARTHGEMLGWWEEMDKLSRDTKSPTSATSRKTITPVHAAVANVGYAEPTVEPTVTDIPIADGGLARKKEEEGVETKEKELMGTHESSHTTAETTHTTTTEQPTSSRALHHDNLEDHTVSDPSSHTHGMPAALGGHVPTTSRPSAMEEEAEEEEEDDEGGSSAEEEEEAERIRTAPSTPAVSGTATSPLDHEGEKASGPAETLPVYAGDGTSQAEKDAFMEKGKPSILSRFMGGGSGSGSS